MRAQAKPGSVIRAVAKAIEAKFDRGDWLELGLITDTSSLISGHRRLLRSLEWNDSDYGGCVLDVVPVVLGDQAADRLDPSGTVDRVYERFANLREVEEFVGLQAWLEENDQRLHQELYAGDAAALNDLEQAARQLGIDDISAHAARIRRGLHEDPAQAIGSAKELLETVLKAVLGLHGTGPETQLKVPKLVKQANVKLGLDAASVTGSVGAAAARRQLLGSLAQIVQSAAELRNAGFGTGHGVSRGPTLDVATARMVVAAAVAAATFYAEASAAAGPAAPLPAVGWDDVPF